MSRWPAKPRDKREGVERKAFRVPIFAYRNDISTAQGWKEIASGRLEAVKCGSRTLVTEEAEREWQRRLPKVVPRGAAGDGASKNVLRFRGRSR